MWYEPNTKAFDLLAPFSKDCQRIVRSLLSDDPAERCPRLTAPDASSRRGVGKFWIASVSIGVIGLIALLRLCLSPSPSSSQPHSPISTSQSLHCMGEEFVFCPCPPGTTRCKSGTQSDDACGRRSRCACGCRVASRRAECGNRTCADADGGF